MPPDDPTPYVDFIAHDEIDPGGFEDLPQPPERPGLRRWRIPLLIAGLVVVVAVVVLAVVMQKSAKQPTAATSSPPLTPSASRTVTLDPSSGRSVVNETPVTLEFLGRLSPAVIAAARTKCPRLAPTCVTTGEAPTGVLRAVRSAFPHATQLIVLSDIAYQISTRRALAYRRISARSGRERISVEIRAPMSSDSDRSGVGLFGATSSAYDETRAANGLTVDIDVSTTATTPPDARAIDRLARDPRLLATG